MRIRELIIEGASKLTDSSETARLDSEILLAHVMGIDRSRLIARFNEPLGAEPASEFRKLVDRRARREPVAYIVGWKDFYGLRIEVTADVLIPRPETEHLVELAVERAARFEAPVRLLDLGTGSGCIAIAIAKELEGRSRQFLFTAVDRSEGALEVARRNAANTGLEIQFLLSNWFEGLTSTFDIIVSNPPYVAESEQHELAGDLAYEPRAALFAGPAGLEAIGVILQGVEARLSPDGIFICEIGASQRQGIEHLLRERLPHCSFAFHKDLAGRDRILELSGAARS